MQHPTLSNIRIRSTRDAHQVFYAVAMNILPMTIRRLDTEERAAITSGNCYVWEERASNSEATGLGIERWTDGMRWSPSRVRDDFLFYHQREADPDEDADLNSTRWARVLKPRAKSVDTSTTGPASTPSVNTKDLSRLVKQTYSVIVSLPEDRQHGLTRKWHLTAYFTQTTVDQLLTVDELLGLEARNVPDGWFRSAKTGRARRGEGHQRPIMFANNYSPDAPPPVSLSSTSNSALTSTPASASVIAPSKATFPHGPSASDRGLVRSTSSPPPQYTAFSRYDDSSADNNNNNRMDIDSGPPSSTTSSGPFSSFTTSTVPPQSFLPRNYSSSFNDGDGNSKPTSEEKNVGGGAGNGRGRTGGRGTTSPERPVPSKPAPPLVMYTPSPARIVPSHPSHSVSPSSSMTIVSPYSMPRPNHTVMQGQSGAGGSANISSYSSTPNYSPSPHSSTTMPPIRLQKYYSFRNTQAPPPPPLPPPHHHPHHSHPQIRLAVPSSSSNYLDSGPSTAPASLGSNGVLGGESNSATLHDPFAPPPPPPLPRVSSFSAPGPQSASSSSPKSCSLRKLSRMGYGFREGGGYREREMERDRERDSYVMNTYREREDMELGQNQRQRTPQYTFRPLPPATEVGKGINTGADDPPPLARTLSPLPSHSPLLPPLPSDQYVLRPLTPLSPKPIRALPPPPVSIALPPSPPSAVHSLLIRSDMDEDTEVQLERERPISSSPPFSGTNCHNHDCAQVHALVPLEDLYIHNCVYARRDPNDDMLLRRLGALKTTPPVGAKGPSGVIVPVESDSGSGGSGSSNTDTDVTMA